MTLEIYLLGQFKLKTSDFSIEVPSRSAQSLLAYLAMNAGVTLRREKLASLVHGEAIESKARGYLRQALWHIRRSLESASLRWEDYLQISEISITFNDQADYWLDADQLVRDPESLPLEGLIDDISLYRGELLPGFYDDWISLERDRLQAAYSQKMDRLLEGLSRQKRWDEILKWAGQWILHGYTPEPAYQALMKAYAGLGNLGMVHATYQRCVEALENDLGVPPSPETTRLYEQIRQGGLDEFESPSALPVKGAPQPLFFSKGGPAYKESPAVVAREHELAQLGGFLDLAVAGQGRIVFVTGEAGSGKTTLVNEFLSQAQIKNPDIIVASGNCNAQFGLGDPYLPFREIFEFLTGDVEARWSAGAITRQYAQFLWDLIPVMAQALLEAGPDLIEKFVPGEAFFERAMAYASGTQEWMSRLERLLERKLTDPISSHLHQSDLFIQYSKVLQVLARRAPLVFVVDDLQWADLGSISLLFHLGRHIANDRILIVGAYRPEEIALGRIGERHPLEPVVSELKRLYGDIEVNIDHIECRAFIDALLDGEPNQLGRQFREMLCNLTRGQPLFTIELLRGMQERGDLIKDETGNWVEGPALDWETLPARVEAVIAERIGRMDHSLQSILQAASVEGETFTAEVVARVQSRDEGEIYARLSNDLDRKHRLVIAQSIQRLDGQLLSSYRFRHTLVHKYLYNSLDEVQRVHLHERVGTVLESMYAEQGRTAAISPQLARHFEVSKITPKAIDYLQQSGERALQVYAYREAIAHLARGLALIASLPDPHKYARQELSLQLSFSMAYNLAMGSVAPEMENASLRALELCREIGSKPQYCQALNVQSIILYVKGEYQNAHRYATLALELGQHAEDPVLIAMANWCLGIAHYAIGDYTQARHYLDQVVSFYDPKQHHPAFVLLRGVDAGMSSIAYLACCLWCLGYPDQALERSRQALDLAHEINHSFTLADVLRYGCCELYKLRQDAQSLKTYAEELVNLSQEKNFTSWEATGKSCLGEALILLGQPAEGIQLIRESKEINLPRGVRCSYSGPLLKIADGYARMGLPEQGLAALSDAFQFLEETGERHWETEYYRILSTLQHMQGDESVAETSLRKALEVARRQKARSWELRAALDLAHLWQKQGKVDEGRQLVSEIYAGFTEGFDTPDLMAARELCG